VGRNVAPHLWKLERYFQEKCSVEKEKINGDLRGNVDTLKKITGK